MTDPLARRLLEAAQLHPDVDVGRMLVRAADRVQHNHPAPSPELAGAILALGYATTEHVARYWLALCARRGADQRLLDHLWSMWRDLNRPTVLHTDERNPE